VKKLKKINKEKLLIWISQRHLFIIRDEDNFAEKASFNFTYLRLIIVLTASFIFLFSLSFIVSNTILSKWFNPVSQEAIIKGKVIRLFTTVDSLENEIKVRDDMLLNMNKVILGEDVSDKKDLTKKTKKPIKTGKTNLDEISPEDLKLRKEFETNSNGKLVSLSNQKVNIKDIFLLSPLPGGIISDRYNSKIGHYGLDIVSKKDEPIKCVSDGTVILSSWTSDTGYVIAVQHQANLISIYKHNSVILKKAGSFVKAGEVIAIIGNTGELTTGPHLHFELWNNGNPVNPEMYISF